MRMGALGFRNRLGICHAVCNNCVRVLLRMQVYCDPSHPHQGQLNSDLSQLEATAQPYDELGHVWDCGETQTITYSWLLL